MKTIEPYKGIQIKFDERDGTYNTIEKVPAPLNTYVAAHKSLENAKKYIDSIKK